MELSSKIFNAIMMFVFILVVLAIDGAILYRLDKSYKNEVRVEVKEVPVEVEKVVEVEKPVIVTVTEYKWVYKDDVLGKKEEPTTEKQESKKKEEPTTEAVTADPPAEPDAVPAVSEDGKTYVGNYSLTAYMWTGNPCADGVYPEVGHTVASNDSRLWHHWIEIEGYGTYYVHDTGGMSSNVLDIYMGDYDACVQFGRRSANVYILD